MRIGISKFLSLSLCSLPLPPPTAGESLVPWGILADSQPGCRWRSGSVYSGGDRIKTRVAQWRDKQPPPGGVNPSKVRTGLCQPTSQPFTSFNLTLPLGSSMNCPDELLAEGLWCHVPMGVHGQGSSMQHTRLALPHIGLSTSSPRPGVKPAWWRLSHQGSVKPEWSSPGMAMN